MSRREIYRRLLIVALLITLVGAMSYYIYYLNGKIPEEIRIVVGKEETFDFSLPIQGEGDLAEVGAINLDKKQHTGQIHMDFSRPFTMIANQTGNMTIRLKLLGFIPIHDLHVNVVHPQEVIPSGMPIGIYVETKGLFVLGTGEIQTKNGEIKEPAKDIIRTGDYILAANGNKVKTTKELQHLLEACEGENVVIDIRRNGQESQVKVQPIIDNTGCYKAGIWVRDSTQGIGTLTYVTMEEEFGALGHGITDVDTGLLMEIEEGYLYKAKVLTIMEGIAGTPGELIGVINKTKNDRLGYIETNTANGITGSLSTNSIFDVNHETMPIGFRQEVELGNAWIRSYVSGQSVDYRIVIEEIELGKGEQGKGMVIRVTDERLLELTGGIVQGMSGSPIVQNGKLVGAVTHVLVNDPTRGYGIFIENMLEAAE